MQVRILSVAFGILVVASFRQPDVRFYGCNLTFFYSSKRSSNSSVYNEISPHFGHTTLFICFVFIDKILLRSKLNAGILYEFVIGVPHRTHVRPKSPLWGWSFILYTSLPCKFIRNVIDIVRNVFQIETNFAAFWTN